VDHAALCAETAAAFAAAPPFEAPVLVGFDGFVDQIIDVVAQRNDRDHYQPMAKIAEFGQRVSQAAGLSTNFEMVVKQRKIGGNGPIMANALAHLAYPVTAIGCFGEQNVDPAFAPLTKLARDVISLGAPANTDALEFHDGKLMLCKMLPLRAVTYANLIEKVGADRLRALLKSAAGIAAVNWTMIVDMTDIWRRLATEVMPSLRADRPLWFADLCDPASRTVADLKAGLEALQALQVHADVVLGLNGLECRQVLAALGETWNDQLSDIDAARRAADAVRSKLGIAWTVVHLVKCAAVAWHGGSVAAEGFYDAKPKITTGAGDHFNGGFFAALLSRMQPAHCLQIGAATSGFYVRSGVSPQRSDVCAFLAAHGKSRH
jgi:sugar/nucleoside kinase (ribokinase family)